MSKTLFDPRVILGDLCIRALPPLVQLFLFRLMALADEAGGRIRLGTRNLDVNGMADALGMCPAEVTAYIDAVREMSWLDRDTDGYFIPAMVKKFALRQKRTDAGKRGGDTTTAGRSDVMSHVCSSKRIDVSKTAAYRASQGKKPEQPVYNNINKNILYIFGQPVSTADRGDKSNPLWINGKVIKLHKREYDAMRSAYPGLSEQAFDAAIYKQDDWLDTQDAGRQAGFMQLTMHSLKFAFGKPVAV